MKKALAKNIKTSQLLEILKNFKEDEYIDIEVFEFSGESPDKIIIRTSRVEEKKKGQEKNETNKESEKTDTQNPKISENISYKDLLDSLN